jgi:hypothetical protein
MYDGGRMGEVGMNTECGMGRVGICLAAGLAPRVSPDGAASQGAVHAG